MDTVQRLEYHIILMIGEGDDILKNARNLFKHKYPTYSSLMQWSNKTQAFTLLDGEWQIVNECTMLHIVGHGDSTYAAARDKEETTRCTLGGLSAAELAFVVQLLLTFNEELSSTCSASIGHVTLVSCQIHDHLQAAGHNAEEKDSQGKGSFITLFLYQLVSKYGIYTSISGWSTAIAVDDDGRILSRVKGSGGLRNDYQWYINYPGSLVFASIISAANYDCKNSSKSLYC